jgi:phosphoribosylformimino-5-aminoimidazole carboxamide ribonucleotide (ProFAR) isomerase
LISAAATVFGCYRETMTERLSSVEIRPPWLDAGSRKAQNTYILVDLDGARDGRSVNRDAIAAIALAVDIPCELGGGIRDEQTIEQMLALGWLGW